ncbi:hypothetical protein SAMN05421863_10657 [Nitrosomonas communis]|uniref:Uncharacterized protein n=1 Tax=Nitrosomonas communis TaxID=44574 RepID=A0A1I4UHM3_9PROT|nr:hypothetical protein SAMN05421863_10657 [Nitrosomonas communis]
MKLTGVSEEQEQRAVDRLDYRPRKVPGFRMPHEVFFGVPVSLYQTVIKSFTSNLNPRVEKISI